jgi:G:T-mismatch repair DNA endonuclease (very short patch repair protein)
MSRIRSSGNKETEGALARILRRHHVTGWRRQADLFGKPDFTFRARRVVRIWEHDLAKRNEARLVGRLRRALIGRV